MTINFERAPRKPRGRRPVETVRIGISLAPIAADWLADEAQRRGITMTDVIRRLIDEARRDYILGRKNPEL
jgi:hypothetical protein